METPESNELWVPCWREWTPRTCKGYDQRSPVDHRCTMPRGIPHICRCSRRCNHNLVNGWHWSLFRSYEALMSALLIHRQLERRFVKKVGVDAAS